MTFARTLALCCWLLGILACHGREIRPHVAMPSAEEARVRLEREGARRLRLDALLSARTSGPLSALGVARVDIALESPARMVVAVRSFFDQPLYTLATDGVVMTSIDSRGAEGARYQAGPVNGQEMVAWLGVELWPHDVVHMFLGVMPVAGSEVLDYRVDEEGSTYQLRLREPSGRISEVTAQAQSDAPLLWSAYAPDGTLRFRVSYEGHTLREGITFSPRWRVEVFDGGRPARVRGQATFDADWWQLNGEPHPDEAFRLSAPNAPSVGARGAG